MSSYIARNFFIYYKIHIRVKIAYKQNSLKIHFLEYNTVLIKVRTILVIGIEIKTQRFKLSCSLTLFLF